MTCGEAREALGALALGVLDHQEEVAVREHLARCLRCAAEHSTLEPVVRLLEGLSVGDLDPVPSGTHDDQLWRVLHGRVVRERRSRRRRSILAAAGTAVAAGVLGVLGGTVIGADGGEPPPGAAPASAVGARDVDTGVHAEVSVREKAWGSALAVKVAGVRPGQECSLVAVGRDGSREIAATWRVPDSGYGPTGVITVPAAVGMAREQIERFEIVTVHGEVLLQIPAGAR